MVYHGPKERLLELQIELNEYRKDKKSAPIVIITAYHVIVNSK